MKYNAKTVAILFGGQSPEHEVSLRSAKNVFDAIDKKKYKVVLIGISKEGRWLMSSDQSLLTIDPEGDEVVMVPGGGGKIFNMTNTDINLKVDVVFPVLHGPYGEDGTVQGLLMMAGVPFVGPRVLGAAVGMDKDVMKRLLRDSGIVISKFVTLRSGDDVPSYEEIEAKLGSVVFIKPANMGSSVGVSKARNSKEYDAAVKEAFKFDSKILIEEEIVGREIECALLGNDSPEASLCGEVIVGGGFYSYDEKYKDTSKASVVIPADITDKETKKIQDVSIHAYKVLECSGLGRVDVFLRPDGEVVVNEINTIPGFTKISMYPKLWEVSGVGYEELVGRLVELAKN